MTRIFKVIPLIIAAISLLGQEMSERWVGAYREGKYNRMPNLQEALSSRQDIWGEIAIGQRDGPNYEFFAKLLPPLRYVNAAFRYYPIVLSAPFTLHKARLISNGSAVNARANLASWREIGTPITFYVGDNEIPFGDKIEHLHGPRYEKGYLPIVQMSYQHCGVSYLQEVFAPVSKPFADHATLFIRFRSSGEKQGKIVARIGEGEELSVRVEGMQVLDNQGRTLLLFDRGWRWNAEKRELIASLKGDAAVLAVFTQPLSAAEPLQIDANRYQEERRKCVQAWEELLRGGMALQVPETIVNHAWRALIVGTFLLAKGDLLCYSVGNAYERQYEAECGDAVRALLLYGFSEQARRMVVPLLDYQQKGLSFHNAAFKLQMLAHYYWLTRDKGFIREQRPRWLREVKHIVEKREPSTGLLPRENYCGDIHKQVYSLSSNANAWRGLRDMAAVLDEMGERDEAQRLAQIAREFRQAILEAVKKSEQQGVQPPFIPIALFGEEDAYETLTASMMGSYWCLIIPYVLGSEIFGGQSERTRWIVDYLHNRGGVCMGMIRFHQHSGLFANENGLDDLYSLRYVLSLLRLDEVERALVSFYGKLAQGLTRETFIGAEGTGLIPLDNHGRPMYLPPNSASNALFLWTLRYLLIQDWDMDDDGKPDTLRLLFATPPQWLKDGGIIRIERAPTAFGELSLKVHSRLRQGKVVVDIELPRHPAKQTLIRIRLPHDWRTTASYIGQKKVPIDDKGTVDISGLVGKVTITFEVKSKSKSN